MFGFLLTLKRDEVQHFLLLRVVHAHRGAWLGITGRDCFNIRLGLAEQVVPACPAPKHDFAVSPIALLAGLLLKQFHFLLKLPALQQLGLVSELLLYLLRFDLLDVCKLLRHTFVELPLCGRLFPLLGPMLNENSFRKVFAQLPLLLLLLLQRLVIWRESDCWVRLYKAFVRGQLCLYIGVQREVYFPVGLCLFCFRHDLVIQSPTMLCIQCLTSVVLDCAEMIIVNLTFLDTGLGSLLLCVVEPLVAVVESKQLLIRARVVHSS